MGLEWTKASDMAIKSGPFTICKCLVRDADKFVLYHGNELVTVKDKSEDAKEAADALHAAGAR
jgi:hypothetical protein